jgi:hypothetical protein
MTYYPNRLEVIIAVLAMVGLLSWMGNDQMIDEAKTAEVIASYDAQARRDQQEHLRQLAELERKAKYMTSYDKLEQVAAK